MSVTPWMLLSEAQEHQRGLLRPVHLDAAEITGLRDWIARCVNSLYAARELEALIGPPGEMVHVETMTARVAAVVDALQLYASMLERSRRAHPPEAPAEPRPRPLSDAADDERVLLSCRGTLRSSMQQLLAALESDGVRSQVIRPANTA
jgi:hypothetical protein